MTTKNQLIEIKAPEFPESVMEGTVAVWHCAVGEDFQRDQLLVDIETDKVVLEVRAPVDGTLTEILHEVGSTVASSELIGSCTPRTDAARPAEENTEPVSVPSAQVQPAVATMHEADGNIALLPSSAARRLIEEHGLNGSEIPASGRGGRLTKGDVLRYLAANEQKTLFVESVSSAAQTAQQSSVAEPDSTDPKQRERIQKRVPMSQLRTRIAERLVSVSRDTAMLTTFNEVDMTAVIEMRRVCAEAFKNCYGIKLGMMPFFIRAAIFALQDFPVLNASIDDGDVVYHGFFDIGVAVSSERGLVVPILRDVQDMSFAEMERSISDYAERAQTGRLSLEEIRGGTFTISNGGVFGSLLSTPMLNPPQVAILGMHAIQQRPIAIDSEVQIRPMMNLALSYDHRLVDGREAVSFLVAIKKSIEQPGLMLPDLQTRGIQE